MQYVFLAILAVITSAIIITLKKLFTKKLFRGIEWVYPLSPIAGYIYMYFFTTSTVFWTNFKNMMLFAFIVSMIIINVKCLLIGAKRTINSGKTVVNEVKKLKKGHKAKDTTENAESGDINE